MNRLLLVLALPALALAQLPSQGGGGGGFANPMTTLGDLIAGGTGGAPARLAFPGNGTAYCLTWTSGVAAWNACPGSGGGISSITWAVPSIFTMTPSPITSNGTVTLTYATGQTSHQVLGTCGTATTFGPCSLVAGDIPTLSYLTANQSITVSSDCTGSGATSISLTCTKTNGNAFTSASYTAIGTSGATIPLLNGANTWSAAQTHSALVDLSGGTLKMPTGAGFTATATSMFGYDSTAGLPHIWYSAADHTFGTGAFATINLYATLASPTFTGTVGGITATMVGLGSVTNNAQTQAATVPNSFAGFRFGNSGSVDTAGTAAQVVALFSTCSGTQYLGADANCHSGGGGSNAVSTTVSYSSTPTFTVTASSTPQIFKMTLTGNVASSTLTTTSATAGQQIGLQLLQDGTGGRTFVYPTNFLGGCTISAVASVLTTVIGVWDGTNVTNPVCTTNDSWRGINTTAVAFSNTPTCTSTLKGSTSDISDSTTTVLGATITGSGSNAVEGFCTGSNWVVGAGGVLTTLPTGTVATTQTAGDNSTKVATTAYTNTVYNLIQTSGSPYTMSALTGTYWNNTASAYSWDLPTPVAGLQICVGNYKAQATAQSLIPGSGVTIYFNGVAGTAGSSTGLVSGGAAGDFICLEGTDSTTYMAIGAGYGTWTNH